MSRCMAEAAVSTQGCVCLSQAHSERTAELSTMLIEVEESHAREMSRLTRTTTSQLSQATEANQELRSRNDYLERQLEKAK